MSRISKDQYYLNIAEQVAARSTCIRRKYGAVIVNQDEVVSTGYNGAPRGEVNCIDLGACKREEMCIPKGERYELWPLCPCRNECNYFRFQKRYVGATIYITGLETEGADKKKFANPAPCTICRRLIVNAGIVRCIGMVDGKPQEISLTPQE